MTDQPDMFQPPEDTRKIIGECWLCGGEHLCQTPALCYPIEPMPEERRL
jgi:hypothetical protein